MKSGTRTGTMVMLPVMIIVTVLIFRQPDLIAQGYAQAAAGNVNVVESIYAGAAGVLEADIEPTEEEIREIIYESMNAWKNPGSIVMANVRDSVNVREEPSEDSERVGKLYNDCGGYILEYTDEWTKIESGELVGWVYNDYLLFGEEAEIMADDVGTYHATVTTGALRVRTEPSLEGGVYGLVPEGDVFEVVEDAGEWIVIDYEGANGYVNSEYVDVSFHIDSGETMEQIEERRAAEREANRIQLYDTYITSNASEVELLGALIQCEAGNQPYEGMVAVGAVVMNRVRSGAYPDTVLGVINASGQFTPVGSGAVARRLENGVSSACLQAAQEAINGYSNVGDATHFRRAGSHEGIVIGGHVFW